VASVRVRAAAGATLVVAVALLAAGLLTLATLSANLGGQAELQARAAAQDVAARLATDGDLADLDLAGDTPVQVVGDDGRVWAVSEGLEEIRGTGTDDVTPAPPATEPAPPQENGDDGGDDDGDDGEEDEDGTEETLRPGEVGDHAEYRDGSAVVDGREHRYRFASLDVTTPRDQDAVVHAGAPLDVEEAAVGSVRTSLLTGFPLLLAVVAGVTWLVTRRALRPVEGIRREMAAITRSADLSRRVPEPAARDEIGRLARTTNETLAALETSVERQRRFVADASHELRSPIASLRTQLEVGRAHPELFAIDDAVQDTVRLQTLAADLLLLARLDAGERPPAGRAVPLGEVMAEELERRPGVRVAELAEVTVTGSRGQLARVVGNLLDNARRHADSLVRVSVRREGGTAVVEVADDGAGVAEADRERIFERFVRLDEARSRDDGGAGLGLAIARDVATRHGGTLTCAPAPEGGALFTLRLPTAADAS
jgi:signal transduction histidine kinase